VGREDARTKGLRYLTEGRLWIRLAGPEGVRAICRGTGDVYELGWDAARGWWCDCPAASRCAHLWALETCTVRPKEAG